VPSAAVVSSQPTDPPGGLRAVWRAKVSKATRLVRICRAVRLYIRPYMYNVPAGGTIVRVRL
jgi:hypothetical protein